MLLAMLYVDLDLAGHQCRSSVAVAIGVAKIKYPSVLCAICIDLLAGLLSVPSNAWTHSRLPMTSLFGRSVVRIRCCSDLYSVCSKFGSWSKFRSVVSSGSLGAKYCQVQLL